jgi:hypothetical protein
MTRNSLQQGYDYLTTIFNGFRELEKRKDAGTELINVYIQLNPTDITNYNTPVERGGFAFKIKYIEILLAQKPILANLNKESKKILIDKSLSNYGIIEKMPDQYATFGLMTPALILGRLLDANNQQEFGTMKSKDDNLRGFINNGDIGDIQILTDIISFSKTYLKQIENE